MPLATPPRPVKREVERPRHRKPCRIALQVARRGSPPYIGGGAGRGNGLVAGAGPVDKPAAVWCSPADRPGGARDQATMISPT